MENSKPKIAKQKIEAFATAAAVEYEERLRRYLRRRLRRQVDLDDLAQEVYLRLLRIKDEKQVMRVREPMAYVYSVAAHVLADWNEATDQCIEHGVDLDAAEHELDRSSDTSLDDPAEGVARREYLEKIFEALPPVQAAALLLLERDGLSYEQIAGKLNLSVGMVHYHITRARARIRLSSLDR